MAINRYGIAARKPACNIKMPYMIQRFLTRKINITKNIKGTPPKNKKFDFFYIDQLGRLKQKDMQKIT
jgi:hypothetical protein